MISENHSRIVNVSVRSDLVRDDDRPLLPPFPRGWYCLGWSRDLPPGCVRPMWFMGEDIVAFRTLSGIPCAMDAYCPHLGAHLGYGGTVGQDTLRCPFHGFQFNVDGICTAVPYGTKPPPKARARVYPVYEEGGILMAFYDPEGRRPEWEIPPLDHAGWLPLKVKEWTLRGHPQETTENSVDLGHFAEIHGYTSVEMIKELVTVGPYLNAKYAMTRAGGLGGRPVRAIFEIHAHGLGYSLVELQVPSYGVRARLFVLATPLDGTNISLRVATTVFGQMDRTQVERSIAWVPWPLLKSIIARQVFAGLVHDVRQDFTIWMHKRYIQPPVLAEGDGPIGKYRLWARQFYRAAEQERV